MARITVEDCIDKFPSRFELVLVASNRARKLYAGENPAVEIDNDKNTVIALREIAEEKFTVEEFKNKLIEEYQVNTFGEDEEIDELEDNSDETQSEENDANINEEKLSNESDIQAVDDTITQSLSDNSEISSDENKEQDL
tara:strand:- start:204 stop:623 length:420 start_codon:yes stop_codon:yes gene_type:complete